MTCEQRTIAILTASRAGDFASVAGILNNATPSELATLALDLTGYCLALATALEHRIPSFVLADMLRDFGLDAAKAEP